MKANNNTIASRSTLEVGAQPEGLYINRELSWLAFNERVIEQSENAKNPLLERLRFLSISASNLDEFYMVRAAGLHGQIEAGVTERSQDGMTAIEQLEAITICASELTDRQQKCLSDLRTALAAEKIYIVEENDLSTIEQNWVEQYFQKQLFPMLTPLAIDPAHPFPFIPNLGFALVLQLKKITDNSLRPALLPLPPSIIRFIELPKGQNKTRRFVPVETIIKKFLGNLFIDSEIISVAEFRIIRDSDIELEEEAEDLVRSFESALKRRRRGNVIRLEVNETIEDNLLDVVAKSFAVNERDIIKIVGLLGLADISLLTTIGRQDLLFSKHTPHIPRKIREFSGDCFSAIQSGDLLLHHPYESFDIVVQFLNQAAVDSNVIAIKQTLYRTSDDSPILKALIQAAELGKSVTAVVELNARFDEEANIRWARNLERAGVQVVYGFFDKKTHAKASIVVRSEGKKISSYVHLGTGNYHPITAKTYSDLSLFTSDPTICSDVTQLFNYLTGGDRPKQFKALSVAPDDLRHHLILKMEREIRNALSGKPAGIWAKLNSLVDEEIIAMLYKASKAGVRIRLLVRGVCCLRPGIPNLSENIEVKSIVGRFLEHSRIVCFANANYLPSTKAEVFISSADWMPRNFDRRIEIMVPVIDTNLRAKLIKDIMQISFDDTEQSWKLLPDNRYTRQLRSNGGPNMYSRLMKLDHKTSLDSKNNIELFKPSDT